MKLLNIIKNVLKKEDEKLNFNKLVKEWLEIKKISIKESTYCNYVYSINNYIMPEFENIEIEELQNYNFSQFTNKFIEKYSSKTTRDIMCILKSILTYGNEEYNYNFKLKKIKSPKLMQEKVEILSNREKGKLENACIRENTLKSNTNFK